MGLMALVLVVLGSWVPWLGVTIVAVMFAGTAIHRWERGTGNLWPVAAVAVLVALAPIWADQAGWWWVQPGVWITTIVLAGATFAGAMALRHRAVPRPLIWLGVISYSVYLLHHPMLRFLVAVVGDVRDAGLVVQVPLAAGYLAAVLALSWATYRFVERPMQRVGRRLGRRVGGQRGGNVTPGASRLPASNVETVTT
jgi:peptidoglycan/LPS O-acetylase OafA/YrhL